MLMKYIINLIKNYKLFFIFTVILTIKQYLFCILIDYNIFVFPPRILLVAFPGITLIILSFSFLLKEKYKLLFFWTIDLLLSLILLSNLWYFRYFNSVISFSSIVQVFDLIRVKEGLFNVIRFKDILFFLSDFFIIFYINKLNYKPKIELKPFFVTFLIGTLMFSTRPVKNLIFKESLFSTYDSVSDFIKFTPMVYQINDIVKYITKKNKYILSDKEKQLVMNYLEENAFRKKKGNIRTNNYKNFGKNKNLIIIQVEALDNFVINREIDRQQITPNLNNVLNNSIYFNNFYSQVATGGTSDIEFVINTSIYPTIKGSCFYNYPNNKYFSLPYLLKKKGYYTIAFHGNSGSFWNRYIALPKLGFDEFKSLNSFEHDEIIGLGLSDESFFKQSIKILNGIKQPFFAYFITLTSHFPFKDLPERYKKLKLPQNLEGTQLGNYIHNIHYTDNAIGNFMNQLSYNNFSDNTIVVIFGDHSPFPKKYFDEFQSRYTMFESYRHQNVPFIIYNKSIRRHTVTTIGGDIDVLPTLADIMGIEENEYIDKVLGKNLLTTNENFVILSNGKYICDNSVTALNNRNENLKGLLVSNLIIRSDYFSTLFQNYN